MLNLFVSYATADIRFAKKLASELKKRKLGVWFAPWEMRVGDSLTRKIEIAIHEASYVAVILSPDSVTSRWVQVELAAAMSREISTGRVTVLPILHRDCELPEFLRDKFYADFRESFRNGFRQLLFALGATPKEMQKGGDLSGEISRALISDWVESASVLELARLTVDLENRFGVSAAVATGPAILHVGLPDPRAEIVRNAVAPLDLSWAPDTVLLSIVKQLRNGKQAEAIKRLRRATTANLRAVTEAIERLQQHLRDFSWE
jgi:ribosomal protein L7/L12